MQDDTLIVEDVLLLMLDDMRVAATGVVRSSGRG